MKAKLLTVMVALVGLTVLTPRLSAENMAMTKIGFGTALNSTNNSTYQQRVIQYLQGAGFLDPYRISDASLTITNILREGHMIVSLNPSFPIYEGESNSTGAKAGSPGSRAFGWFVYDGEPIQPNQVDINVSITDGYGTNGSLGFVANLATNSATGLLQPWSTTLSGGTNGHTLVYTSGLMTNYVTRIVYSGARVAWTCTDVESLKTALQHFRGYHPLVLTYTYTVWNSDRSAVLVRATDSKTAATFDVKIKPVNGTPTLIVTGQNYIGYELQSRTNLDGKFFHPVSPIAEAVPYPLTNFASLGKEFFRVEAIKTNYIPVFARSATPLVPKLALSNASEE